MMPDAYAPVTVGSSDVASILGVGAPSGVHRASPWKTWSRLVGLVERYGRTDDPESAAGRMMEPAIGLRYAQERGLVLGATMWPGPPITAAPLIGPEPWMAARPDFLASSGGAWERVVECKAPRTLELEDGWGEPGTDRAPSYYLVQVTWQMVVTGLEHADLAAFGRVSSEWRVYSIPRRERLAASIVARVRDWYERYVIGDAMPPIDGTPECGQTLARLHPGRADKVWLDPEPPDLALARDLAGLRRQIAELEEAAAIREHRLCERIGDAYGLRGVARWSPRKGRAGIDLAALKRDHPEIAAKYTTAGKPGRSFALLTTTDDGDDR